MKTYSIYNQVWYIEGWGPMTLNFEILDYLTNRYTVKKAVYSKSIQNVRRWVLVGYMAGKHGKSWMRSNGKFGIWYVKKY